MDVPHEPRSFSPRRRRANPMEMKPIKVPAKPSNETLGRIIATGFAQVHACVEAGKVEMQAQVHETNKKVEVLAGSVQPVTDLIADFVRWRRRIIGALGALALTVAGSAASSIYNSLTLNSHSAAMTASADQNAVNEQLLLQLKAMQAQQAARSVASADSRARQNAVMDQMLQQLQKTPAHRQH